jgi:DNA-binding NarL/FixJ family response regulator
MLGSSFVCVVGGGETPRQCIEGILETRPDVVVLDVQLDGGSGLDVMRAVRAVNPDIAFVVFSNNSLPAYRKRYLQAGAARFLDKSTESDQLVAAVQAAPGSTRTPN